MVAKKFSVLVIEDNAGDARLLQEMMKGPNSPYKLNFTDTLTKALELLIERDFDIVLLDLGLPDSRGIETYHTLHRQMPKVPVIVLSGLNDEAISIEAVQEGAQDYLIKGEVSGSMLSRSIRYAIERNELKEKTYHLSLMDQLTGLYNRRGFQGQAEREMLLADRINRRMHLLFADLDNMKRINDELGHHEGDSALIRTAQLLRDTFRSSDIVARLGGDEFVVLMTSETDSIEPILERLNQKIDECNRENNVYTISLSFGIAEYIPQQSGNIDELLKTADANMYKAKKSKKAQ
ncbi:GGDEF domain-containing response regulator [Paenibacillus turpanensis]|uniref:GGDEF domain-containing response regulator n=1 Tax=Paenibacillus turpanensis TaxID=2689078 RepID=UPI0014078B12|nr:GGDEF domain-containing response regulator [Paenibacillus turpanensis]